MAKTSAQTSAGAIKLLPSAGGAVTPAVVAWWPPAGGAITGRAK